MIRILAVSWLAFLVVLSASKSLGYGHWVWGSIERFLRGNLQMHFVMAFILFAGSFGQLRDLAPGLVVIAVDYWLCHG